jgi:poly(3-hydroxybutyrate) depolymerase
MNHKKPFIAILLMLLWVYPVVAAEATESKQLISWEDIPTIDLKEEKSDISAYRYLGTWIPEDKTHWQHVARLNLDKQKLPVSLAAYGNPSIGAKPANVTPETEALHFRDVMWEKNQVSAMTFCCISPEPQAAILEVAGGTYFAVYNNGEYVMEVNPSVSIETGSHQYVPVALDEGRNFFLIMIPSDGQPPRIRMSIVLDQLKDFQAAWSVSSSFLNKNIFPIDEEFEAPTLKWNGLLQRLTISAQVRDCRTGKIVATKEKLRNGSVIRSGMEYLKQGLFEINYSCGDAKAHEYFIIGSPRRAFEPLKSILLAHTWDVDTMINIDAQIKRGDVLLDRKNYDSDNREWQCKVAYTLCILAGFAKTIQEGNEVNFKNMPGMHIRGFISKIDQSRQFYRIFIPSTYTSTKSIPLLVIMPTPVSAKSRPFIEGPVMGSYRQAVDIGNFAEKHGFAIVWPGYRNAPEGWSYESTHTDEVIKAIENNYNIDHANISIYGACGGGFFAGRLVAHYPRRFSAIVYDRAYFDRDVKSITNAPDTLKYWHETIDPSEVVIDNENIKIFVLNDGSQPVGHGEIKLSEIFIEKALKKRTDVKCLLGRRPTDIEPWDLIFDWLATCKNKNYTDDRADNLIRYGYCGPISEVFSTPFFVVESESGNKDDRDCLRAAIESLKAKYAQQFHGANLPIKKASDVIDQDINNHSLVLIGNMESNKIWKRLERNLPVSHTSKGVIIHGKAFPNASAFTIVSKNPENKKYFVLLIGANEFRHLKLTDTINPFRAWYDCCIFEKQGEYHKQRTINTLANPTTNHDNS